MCQLAFLAAGCLETKLKKGQSVSIECIYQRLSTDFGPNVSSVSDSIKLGRAVAALVEHTKNKGK